MSWWTKLVDRRLEELQKSIDYSHSDSWHDGWKSHEYGKKLTDNPYDKETQKASYNSWDSGFCNRNHQVNSLRP